MRHLPAIVLLLLAVCSASAQKLDPTFKAQPQNPGHIAAMLLVEDNKVLVGGYFTQFGPTKKSGLLRLNADYTIDNSFNSGGVGAQSNYSGPESVNKIIRQPDGKILIIGGFNKYNGVERQRIARLHADGSLDMSFNPPGLVAGREYEVSWSEDILELMPNGKMIFLQRRALIVDANTTNYTKRLIRLNSDGSIDNTFTGIEIDDNVIIDGITDAGVQTDGKVIVTGYLKKYGDKTVGGVLRLNADGSFDNTFNIGSGANDRIDAVVIRPDGKIVLAGEFKQFNGIAKTNMVMLNPDGSIDNTFTGNHSGIWTMELESSGTLLATGNYGSVKRISATGVLLKSFKSISDEINDPYNTAIVLNDGKLLVGGFTQGMGYSFLRLNEDFTRDLSFVHSGPTLFAQATHVRVLPDGKILLAGDFAIFDGVKRGHIVRLNKDLTVDETFNVGVGFNHSYVPAVAVQSNGKVIVQTSTYQSQFNGVPTPKGITRLNVDGSRDDSFKASTKTEAKLQVTLNDKIFAYGPAASFNDYDQQYLLRLNADGTSDNTFAPKFNGPVTNIVAMKNGKVMVTGTYTQLNSSAATKLLRLNENGSLDTSFDPKIELGSNSELRSMEETSDGKLMLFGKLRKADASDPKYYMALRLLDNGSIDPTFAPTEVTQLYTHTGKILNDKSFIVISDLDARLTRFSEHGKVINGPEMRIYRNAPSIELVQNSTTSFIVGGPMLAIDNVQMSLAKIDFEPAPPDVIPPVGTVTGLEEDFSHILVYPNPANDKVFVKGIDGKVNLFDAIGNNVGVYQADIEGTNIDLSGLSVGVYFLRIHTENGVHVRKILHN